MHLFLLQRLKEAFHLRIIIEIADGRHTDLHSDRVQLFHILSAGILDSAIRRKESSLATPFGFLRKNPKRIRSYTLYPILIFVSARRDLMLAGETHKHSPPDILE
jgi:hypothetical protein